MITIKYNNDTLNIDSSVIRFFSGYSNFENKKEINVSEEVFNELVEINKNLFHYRTVFSNYYSDYYIIKSLYHQDFLDIIERNSYEIFPEFTFGLKTNDFFQDKIESFDYSFKKPSECIYFLLDFSDNIVIGGSSVMSFLFGLVDDITHLYIHSDNSDILLNNVRKHLSERLTFHEDDNNIYFGGVILHKYNYGTIQNIAKSFIVDCEQCVLNMKTKIVYKTELCIYSHDYRIITFLFENCSSLYYYKIASYLSLGFSLFIPYENSSLIFPHDFENFEYEYTGLEHRGILLLICTIYTKALWNEQDICQEKFIFDNNEDFFNYENEIFPDVMSADEISKNPNLKYWFSKLYYYDVSSVFRNEPINCETIDFLNILFGYNIYHNDSFEIKYEKTESLIKKMVKFVLLDLGYEIDYEDCNHDVFYYIEFYKNYIDSSCLNIDYLHQCSLLSEEIKEKYERLKKYQLNEKTFKDFCEYITWSGMKQYVYNRGTLQKIYIERTIFNKHEEENIDNKFYFIKDGKYYIKKCSGLFTFVNPDFYYVSEKGHENFSEYRSYLIKYQNELQHSFIEIDEIYLNRGYLSNNSISTSDYVPDIELDKEIDEILLREDKGFKLKLHFYDCPESIKIENYHHVLDNILENFNKCNIPYLTIELMDNHISDENVNKIANYLKSLNAVKDSLFIFEESYIEIV